MKKSLILMATLLAGVASPSYSDDAAIRSALKKYGLDPQDIKPSPIAGLNSVITAKGVLYVSDNGKYLLEGTMYDIGGESPVNVINKQLLKYIDELKDEMIVFKAPKEKYVITVFTDITCGYCKKLHASMNEYNARGITVRYLAFPRYGLQHESAKQMAAIWSNAMPQKALMAAMKGDDIQLIDKSKVDLGRHMRVGRLMGVNGTPAIVLDDGTLLSGYLPPEALEQVLIKHKKVQ